MSPLPTPSLRAARFFLLPALVLAALAALPLWDSTRGSAPAEGVLVSRPLVLEDPKSAARPEDILAKRADFRPALSNNVNYGLTRSTIWLMVEAANLHAEPAKLYLTLWNPGLDDLTLTVRHADGTVKTISTGDMRADRPVPWAAGQALPFTLEPGERVSLVLRSHTEAGAQILPVEILDEAALDSTNHLKSFLHGLMLGVFAALFIANATIYRTLRDPTYGYYALYLLASLFVAAGLTGMGMTTLWPDNVWLSNEGVLVMGGLAKLLLVQFSRRFLDTSGLTGLDRLLRACAWTALFFLLCALLLPAHYAYRIGTVVLFAFPCAALWAGVSAWCKGRTQARYYILGQTASWFGLLVFGLIVNGVLPYSRFTFEIIPVSICLDALLLSLALADRLRLLQTQKQEAQDEARRNLAVRGEELERLVKERTVQLALAKDQALSLARTDPLTGAFNRRYMMEAGRREMARAVRLNAPLSVILLDIDRFKQANDTYGHAQGDAVLKAVAAAIMERIRASDLFFRWGGDEFLALLPDTSTGEALALAERLREAVAGAVAGGPMAGQVTSSFGVATRSDADKTLGDVISRADKALYQAKRSGRDRVQASGDGQCPG